MADQTFGAMRQEVLIIPTGDFIVRAVKADAVKNSKGDWMIKTQLEVIAGPHTGYRVTNNFNIMPTNPNAFAMFFRQMDKFGLDQSYFDRVPSGETGVHQIARDIVGRVVEIKLGKRTWNGADMPNVEEIRPAPAGFGGSAVLQSAAQPLTGATPLAVEPDAVGGVTTVSGSAGVDLSMAVGDTAAGSGVEVEAARSDTEPSEPPQLPF